MNKGYSKSKFESRLIQNFKHELPMLSLVYKIRSLKKLEELGANFRKDEFDLSLNKNGSNIYSIYNGISDKLESQIKFKFENVEGFYWESNLNINKKNSFGVMEFLFGTRKEYFNSTANDTISARNAVNYSGRIILDELRESMQITPSYLFSNFDFERTGLDVSKFREGLSQWKIRKLFF